MASLFSCLAKSHFLTLVTDVLFFLADRTFAFPRCLFLERQPFFARSEALLFTPALRFNYAGDFQFSRPVTFLKDPF